MCIDSRENTKGRERLSQVGFDFLKPAKLRGGGWFPFLEGDEARK